MKPSWRSGIFSSVAAFLLAMITGLCAQDKPAPDQTGGKTVTVTGCLTGMEGHYTLGTMSDQLFLLQGEDTQLKKFNAQRVRVTGSVTEPPPHTSRQNVLSQQPPTLTIHTIKKVADTCS